MAVPRLPQIAGGTSPLEADSDLALLRDLVAWLRSAWAERAQLAAAPATGLAGHSFGAGLAGRLAGEGNLRAFASLSGSVARVTRDGIHVPKLPLPLTLTVEQQSFAGGWLSGFPLLADEAGSCHVSLSWETSEETGSTTQP